jgi:hypothetical protein
MKMVTAAALVLPCSANAGTPETKPRDISAVSVVPGTGIADSRVNTMLHGSNWKLLWNTPIRIPLLDLHAFAGGLNPIEQGADHLSNTRLFQGADGKRYLFVTLDKDAARGLAVNLRGSALESVMRAETRSFNPVAELMMPPLLEAAGVPHVNPRLILLPRDPSTLGRFDDAFGGVAGTLEEQPAGSDTASPGFMGARRIAGTDEVLQDLAHDSGNAVDARAYLKARLVDILVGDGDRMPDQWTWASYGDFGHHRWVPVPIRHYQAFSRKSGRVHLTPHLQDFGPKYPDMKHLTGSARKLDRRILAGLSRSDWMGVTKEFRLALSDSVIADAVRRMPPEMYALEGKRLERELMARRDLLDEASSEFYLISAKVVEIHASAKAEKISAHRLPDGGIDIVILRKGSESGTADDPPIFRRTFVPGETRELRIHTGGGEDEIVVDGPAAGNAIVARFIDSNAPIRFEDLTGEPSRERQGSRRTLNYLYDAGPGSAVSTGPNSAVGTRREEHDPGLPDSGSKLSTGISNIQLNYSPDYGVLAGWGVVFEKYGFDADPYLYRSEVDGAVAYGEKFRYRFRLTGDIGTLFRDTSLHLEASCNTLDILTYYGPGNETHPVNAGVSESFFETGSKTTTLLASLRYPSRRNQPYFWEVGIEAKWITTDPEPNSFFELNRARIAGVNVDFANNLQLGFHFDSRDNGQGIALMPRAGDERTQDRRSRASTAALSGMAFDVVGRYYPESIGNSSAFGKLNGEFRTFVPLNETRYSRIAFRVGGQKNWGEYPFFEAAAVGGSNSIRGFDRKRFSGDAAVYANTELRLYAGRGRLLVPILYGPLLFVDTGRVFLAGESSSQWHTGTGGGIWIAFFEPRYSAHLSIARGLDAGRLTDGYGIYAQAGFSF